jgi:hypothetical protein
VAAEPGPPRGAAAPPWVLACPVVTITRPPSPDIEVTVRTPAVIGVAWPPFRVARGPAPPAPGVIRLRRPPQGPWRLPLPGGHPLRNPDLYREPPRAPRPG